MMVVSSVEVPPFPHPERFLAALKDSAYLLAYARLNWTVSVRRFQAAHAISNVREPTLLDVATRDDDLINVRVNDEVWVVSYHENLPSSLRLPEVRPQNLKR